MFFENRRKYSKVLTQDLRSGELIHLLFAEASFKMVSLEVWLSRSHVYREEIRKEIKKKKKVSTVQPSINHGKSSVMLWSCMSASGVGDLVKFDPPGNAIWEGSDWQQFHVSE